MKILISSCLLGQNVRYDGGNCFMNSSWIAGLAASDQIVSLCPEVASGMSVPRAPIELKNGEVVDESGVVITEQFGSLLDDLEKFINDNSISMAIMKDKSPSCGVRQIYDGSFSGTLIEGQGLFSKELTKYVPVFCENELYEAEKYWNTLKI